MGFTQAARYTLRERRHEAGLPGGTKPKSKRKGIKSLSHGEREHAPPGNSVFMSSGAHRSSHDQCSPDHPVLGTVARGYKTITFQIGDRVVNKHFGTHGVILSKCGGSYRIQYDDGRIASGGFCGFNIVRERTA